MLAIGSSWGTVTMFTVLYLHVTPVNGLNKFGVLKVAQRFADGIVSAGRGEVPGYNA